MTERESGRNEEVLENAFPLHPPVLSRNEQAIAFISKAKAERQTSG